MLALLPVQSTFFKLQMDQRQLTEGKMDPRVKSEMDLGFASMEKIIMDSIAASDDRVAVHQAMKHLVVSGNALIYMDKDKLKVYPLNRYVLSEMVWVM